MSKTAIVIGATGLVGQHLLNALVACGRYEQIFAVVRRVDAVLPQGVTAVVVADFHQLSRYCTPLDLQDADAFSTLGTTLKQAGSASAFQMVDHGFNLSFAQLCHQGGVRHFLLLSALGASPTSSVFYNRVKGELEHDVRALEFPLLSIFEPSLLLGEHQDPRLAETIAQKMFAWVKPVIPATFAYRPIEAVRVAQAMCQVAGLAYASPSLALAKPVQVYSNADLLALTLELKK